MGAAEGRRQVSGQCPREGLEGLLSRDLGSSLVPTAHCTLQPLASAEGRLAQGWCRVQRSENPMEQPQVPLTHPKHCGRGSKHSQVQPRALAQSPARPTAWRCCLFQEAFRILPGHASSLACSLVTGLRSRPTLVWCPLNQCWPRAFLGSRAQEVPARPSLQPPCLGGQPGSPGPASASVSANTREADWVLACRDPANSHGAHDTGHFRVEVLGQHLNQLPDSRSQPEQFGQSW